MRSVIAVAIFLLGSVGSAQEPAPAAPPPAPSAPPPAPPAPPPPPSAARVPALDPRVPALEARLRALEEEKRTADQQPLAGYDGKNIFVRDRHDWFVLFPKGRVQVDWYNFLNRPSPPTGVVPNSAADPRATLRDGLFIRRARIDLAGTVARHIDFRMEAEFASVPSPGQYASITDGYIVLNWVPWLKLQAGQFFTPFTAENQTSDNYVDFMERSFAIRWAVPAGRELGGALLGELPHGVLRYHVGLFNGDGQNFKNQDNFPAVIGRVVLHPLNFWRARPDWLADLWVGGSFWWQEVNNIAGGIAASTTGATQNDLPSATTQGGFSIFSSNYNNGTDAMKNVIRSHLGQDGTTYKYAFELNVPIGARLGVRGELVHAGIDLRQYNDAAGTRTAGAPGHLDGWGGYVEAWAWVWHKVDISRWGYYDTPHWGGYRAPRPTALWGLFLAAKWEHIEFAITDLPTGNGGAPDPAGGHFALDAFELGANLWFSRHARLTANYILNYVGAGDPREASSLEKKNLFFQQYEHELLFRLQVSI